MRIPLVLVLLAGLGCGGSAEPGPATPEPTPEPAAAAQAGEQDPKAGCVRIFTRQRECTDVFIPALVSWRVELDVPAGVAARDQAEGRDALVAVAMEEWKHDSTDEAIAATCDSIIASIPADQLAPMVDAGNNCLAQGTCEAFVDCMAPMHKQRLEAQRTSE